jgi:hypothetical protein
MKQILEDTIFLGSVVFSRLSNQPASKIVNTTPDVSNLVAIEGSGVVITVTNFLGGIDTQTIRIRGDGTTTIKNNTTIVTNTGVDKLLTLNRIYRFTYFASSSIWIEDI